MITFCDSHCQNIFNLVSPYTFLDAWRVWVQPVEIRRGVPHWGEAQGLWRLCPQLCQPVQPAGRRGEYFKDCVFIKTRESAISVKLWILNQLRWGSRTMGTKPTKMWLRGDDNFISVLYLHCVGRIPTYSLDAGLVWARRRLACLRPSCSRGRKGGRWRRWPGGALFFFFFFAHGAPRGHKMIFRFPNPLTKWVGEPMIGINDAIKITHIVEQLPRYGGDYTMASLRLFLASKAGLSITMEGCIKWVKW